MKVYLRHDENLWGTGIYIVDERADGRFIAKPMELLWDGHELRSLWATRVHRSRP